MVPVEWLVFLIPFIASLLKTVWEGKESKLNILFILLLMIGGTVLGIIFAFIDAFLMRTQFTLATKDLITYLFNAFIGAVIIPIARYLVSVKIE